jgi:DNA repair photolyase
MKKIINASRRTDLVAFLPGWLSKVLKEERARVVGPSRHAYTVDLNPESVHTVILWSKNFSNLIKDKDGLRAVLQKYDQLYLHFTITGLGGTFIEKGVPPPSAALSQLDSLIEIAGTPKRISVRFDPVIYWKEDEEVKTNLSSFKKLAPELASRGIENIRFSLAQWYGKAVRRAAKYGFNYVDPSEEEKKKAARSLDQEAKRWKLRLYGCSQDFLSKIPGIQPSSCVDGFLLSRLHPKKEEVSTKKDRSQRAECRCTESIDIGSYMQSCPHSCLYCYANPRI